MFRAVRKLLALVICLLLYTSASGQQLRKSKKSDYPTTCEAALASGNGAGAYLILISNHLTNVYCDEHGRMLIQQQVSGPKYFFNRDWWEYRNGFGDPKAQYWFGLEKLHQLTNAKRYELFLHLTDFANGKWYANYDHFVIGNQTEKYVLKQLGELSGNVTDNRLATHLNDRFSTFDQDNDTDDKNCASELLSGWWYASCSSVNFNNPVRKNDNDEEFSVLRWSIGQPLKKASMYIKLH